MGSIVDKGRLTIPLYHGTNSIWYESICAVGLGGHNVIEELRVIELLAELLAISNNAGIPRDSRHVSAEAIAEQRVVPRGLHFRHGSTYLCASAVKAAGYTRSNRSGSEAIECCLSLYDLIRASRPGLLEPIMSQMKPLASLADKGGVPLVLEVRSIPAQILRDGRGDDVKEALDRFQKLVTHIPDEMPTVSQILVVESIGHTGSHVYTA